MRGWPRRLQGQVVLLVGLVLGATVLSYAWLTTRTQAARFEEGLRAEAAIIARNLAERGAHHLLVGEYAELEALLISTAALPSITAIRVTEPDGTVLVDIRHPPGGPAAAHAAPRSAPTPPGPLRPAEIVGDALVLQEPIQAGSLLGRVTLTCSLRSIAEMQAATWRRGLALGGLWTLGGTLLLLGLLRPRLRAIQDLAIFARRLDQGKGDTLPVRHEALEIAELGDALNFASRELQATERQLLADRERLAVTLASIGDGVVAVDPAGAVVFSNRVAETLTGWAAPEAVGHPLTDILVLLDAETRDPVAPVGADGGPLNRLILRGRTGVERRIVVTVAPMQTEHGSVLGTVLVVRDVTAQIQAEAALARRTGQLEAVQAVAAEITRELRLDAVLTLVLQRALQMTETQVGTLYLWDEASQSLVPSAMQGYDAAVLRALRFRLGEGVAGTVARDQRGCIVNDFVTSPYRTHPVLAQMPHTAVLAAPLLYRERLLGVIAINNGTTARRFEPEDLEHLQLFAAHAAIAIENARLFAELNQAFADLQAAQATLVQSEKLRALGQLAGGIAHDLNNKLMVILGQAEILRFAVSHPALEAELAPLEAAAQQSAVVIRGILDFARQGARVPTTPVDLAPVVQAALALTVPQWKDAADQRGTPITLQTALADCPPILGTAAEVQEALVHVLLNALEAMPAGGTLAVVAHHVRANQERSAVRQFGGPCDPKSSTQRTAEPSNSRTVELSDLAEFVDLTVTDTGVGMPPAVQAKALEPFFTTKGVQRAGLGLAAVYGILQRHGGAVTLASVEGQGMTVTLRFRAAPSAAV